MCVCVCNDGSAHSSGCMDDCLIQLTLHNSNPVLSSTAILMESVKTVSSISTAGAWSCPVTTGERPPPCAGFTFTAVDDRRAVMFGGGNREKGPMNDVYIIDFSTMVKCVCVCVSAWACSCVCVYIPVC